MTFQRCKCVRTDISFDVSSSHLLIQETDIGALINNETDYIFTNKDMTVILNEKQ